MSNSPEIPERCPSHQSVAANELIEVIGAGLEAAEKLSVYFRALVVSAKNDDLGQLSGQTIALPNSVENALPEVCDLGASAHVAASEIPEHFRKRQSVAAIELVEVIGAEAADALLSEWGGTRIFIPAKIPLIMC